MKTKIYYLLSLLSLLWSSSCTPQRVDAAQVANPAAVFCEEHGYDYQIREDEDGSQYSVCVFSETDSCDGWAYYRGECAPQEDMLELTPAPTVTEIPLGAYRDDDYRVALSYPPNWTLDVQPIGDAAPQSKLLVFTDGYWKLTLHYKFRDDVTVIQGGLGMGEIEQDGSLILLGQVAPVNKLIYESKTKLTWVGLETDDLVIYAKLEDTRHQDYADIDIPVEMNAEITAVLETIIRTGEPFSIPTQTSIPIVTAMPTTVPTALPTSMPLTCNLPPQLVIGGLAVVSPGLPNVIRSAPGRGSDSAIIDEVIAGRLVTVLGGPVCADGYYWWKVDTSYVQGWTAEGQNDTYWLVPYAGGDVKEVDGWVGALVTMPDSPQVDDYFQMLDQNGSRYGIHALNENVRTELESYRDTGTLIRIWGILYYGRMDAYNTQIEVSRFEEYIP